MIPDLYNGMSTQQRSGEVAMTDTMSDSVRVPEKCPQCGSLWKFSPPVNHDDQVVMPDGSLKYAKTNGYICQECKHNFRLLIAAAPRARCGCAGGCVGQGAVLPRQSW